MQLEGVALAVRTLEAFMRVFRCLVLVSLFAGMGSSLGCGSGEASIMRGMERGTGEAKEVNLPLKGGRKKPEPRMDVAPRMVPDK
jgi:hypothetical protein